MSLPTVSCFEPSSKVPTPSIEPAVIPPVNRVEISNTPPALTMKRAFPPVTLLVRPVTPPELVIKMALPAVLALTKNRFAALPTIKVGALEEADDAGTDDSD
jgi:hypothetical protein